MHTGNGIFSIFGHAVISTFDLLTQNLIGSSLSQDALMTKGCSPTRTKSQ